MHDRVIIIPQTFLQMHPHHTDLWFWLAFGWTIVFCVGLILLHGRRIRVGSPYWWFGLVTGAAFPAAFALWWLWLFA